ncbi:microtubule-associated proteins 1A/1B light chain 3C [Gouania willdenowi]|uniref:microtubule-associated proteins 1A/1B light chain 3C n=1 Tax=Gouania willdenowi TaxID=441366 RepID=UPI001054F435|nr:microtubule-associated proteins 1A/1B light chain 3C-like [Gouania willdenowi]
MPLSAPIAPPTCAFLISLRITADQRGLLILPPEGTQPSARERPTSHLHHRWSLQTALRNTHMAPFEKSMEMMPFKQRKCLETRKDEVCNIRSKFPNKLPVIVERYIREKTLPLLDKTKFLVPFEFTFGQFLCLLRNKIDLDSTQALFLLVAERSMSCMSSSMGEVYSRYRDTDGFLYITYASQEMFGAPQPAVRPPP